MAQVHMRGKLKKDPAPSLIKYINLPGIEEDAEYSYQTYLDLNKAHVVMCAKQGIIDQESAKIILKVTQEMAAMGDHPNFPIDPALESMYFNLEKYLIEHAGIEAGGKVHTARSRNDLVSTKFRIDFRKIYFEICSKVNELREIILEKADEYKDVVLAGYTHLQPSEPITFGHYLACMLSALERDYHRLSEVYNSLNICPLGGGSMGSTTFPIDRELTSKLLGFDAPVDNSLDCVGSRDWALELLAAVSIMANNLSRFAHDFYVWATPQFGYIDLDDSVSICSSIMPQKKNPQTLEQIKGRAGNVEGTFAAAYSAMKNTPYTNCSDGTSVSVSFVRLGLHETAAILDLMIDTMNAMTPNKERLLQEALTDFCTMTELANTLVRVEKISFREAHEVVAMVVDHMLKTAKKANEVTAAEVDQCFNSILQKHIVYLTDDDVAGALDPSKNVRNKNCIGGTSETEIKRQLSNRAAKLADDKKLLSARVQAVHQANIELNKAVDELIGA